MTAPTGLTFEEARRDGRFWGRLVETAAGASLAATTAGKDIRLFYWSGLNREVDYILSRGKRVTAIEVKSGSGKTTLPGIEAFAKRHEVTKKLLVGPQGISLEDFLGADPESLL